MTDNENADSKSLEAVENLESELGKIKQHPGCACTAVPLSTLHEHVEETIRASEAVSGKVGGTSAEMTQHIIRGAILAFCRGSLAEWIQTHQDDMKEQLLPVPANILPCDDGESLTAFQRTLRSAHRIFTRKPPQTAEHASTPSGAPHG
jgi:hypothetical protein